MQVVFNTNGIARAMIIRDFGDGRIWITAPGQRGYSLKPYICSGILPTVFEGDIQPVRTCVVDACFVSHLHEIAICLTELYGSEGNDFWKIIAEEPEHVFC